MNSDLQLIAKHLRTYAASLRTGCAIAGSDPPDWDGDTSVKADYEECLVLATRLELQSSVGLSLIPGSGSIPVAGIYLDEIDAARAGNAFLMRASEATDCRPHRLLRQAEDSSGPRPQCKTICLFDSLDRLRAAFILTRDQLNRTQLSLWFNSTIEPESRRSDANQS